jgi:hypothetical protein
LAVWKHSSIAQRAPATRTSWPIVVAGGAEAQVVGQFQLAVVALGEAAASQQPSAERSLAAQFIVGMGLQGRHRPVVQAWTFGAVSSIAAE